MLSAGIYFTENGFSGEIDIYGTDERAVRLALYLLEHDATVRKAARVFGVSKSTVHKDVTARLKQIDLSLYEQTARLLEKNKNERHLRGGMATKLKYSALRESLRTNGKKI